jgi:hypothetical protein
MISTNVALGSWSRRWSGLVSAVRCWAEAGDRRLSGIRGTQSVPFFVAESRVALLDVNRTELAGANEPNDARPI